MTNNSFRSVALRNAVLRSIPAEELETISPFLSRVKLVPQQILVEQGETVEHVYFIEHGIILLREASVTASPIQVAMIGREGVVGCEALLRADEQSLTSAVAQQESSALRIPLRDLAQLIDSCPVLKERCMHAILAELRQFGETAASAMRDSLSQRCIRLLLMIHDRIEGEDVQITHEALSAMLGVRRSGVTLVATDLQVDRLVRVNRGRITILDRAGLERQLPKTTRRREPSRLEQFDSAPA